MKMFLRYTCGEFVHQLLAMSVVLHARLEQLRDPCLTHCVVCVTVDPPSPCICHVELSVRVAVDPRTRRCEWCPPHIAGEDAMSDTQLASAHHQVAFSVDKNSCVHYTHNRLYNAREWIDVNVPCTPEHSARTLKFLSEQLGKPFHHAALWSNFWCCWPWRRTTQGSSWFCSELAAAALQAGGLMSPDVQPARMSPVAVYNWAAALPQRLALAVATPNTHAHHPQTRTISTGSRDTASVVRGLQSRVVSVADL